MSEKTATDTGPLERLLKLALRLSGASFALAAHADGRIAATAGSPPKGADAAGLGRVALAAGQPFALPDVRSDPKGRQKGLKGVGFFAAAPADSAGAIAVVAAERLAPSDRLLDDLEQLAALAAGELAGAGPGDERETLFAEFDHRVKNVLASVQAIASQSARRAVSLDGFLKAFTGRLKAMASAQELLTASRWRGASIHHLATATLSTLTPGQARWDGPDVFLNPRAANALALALHELTVNAVRHGALSAEAGAVEVRWRPTAEGGFELDWIESGGPKVSPPASKGFGSLLLEGVTGRELDGEVVSDYRASGLRVRIKGSPKALVEGEAAPHRPARQTTVEPTAPPAHPPAPPGSKVRGMRIIIVEDAALLAMELEAGLLEAGAEVVGSAALVEEAMALVDLPMDAAVLDCNLNGASVEPVARALAARGVPFLFATGYGENRGAPEGFDAPIIRKPYDVAQITAALADLTGRS